MQSLFSVWLWNKFGYKEFRNVNILHEYSHFPYQKFCKYEHCSSDSCSINTIFFLPRFPKKMTIVIVTLGVWRVSSDLWLTLSWTAHHSNYTSGCRLCIKPPSARFHFPDKIRNLFNHIAHNNTHRCWTWIPSPSQRPCCRSWCLSGCPARWWVYCPLRSHTAAAARHTEWSAMWSWMPKAGKRAREIN